MAKLGEIYVDSEGVRRGYYVYLHRCKTTGDVFYVGKGQGRRAWDVTTRNQQWRERAAALPDGWEVKIAADDLSELEAFELEERLVEEHGGSAWDGGTLTNLVPGGEDPIKVTFGIDLGPDFAVWYSAYIEAREFKMLELDAQRQLLEPALARFDRAVDLLDRIEESASGADAEVLEELAIGLAGTFESVRESVVNRLAQRVSLKQLGLALEDAIEDLETFIEDEAPQSGRISRLARHLDLLCRELLAHLDSGNRKAAEMTADEAVAKWKAETSCENENTETP